MNKISCNISEDNTSQYLYIDSLCYKAYTYLSVKQTVNSIISYTNRYGIAVYKGKN